MAKTRRRYTAADDWGETAGGHVPTTSETIRETPKRQTRDSVKNGVKERVEPCVVTTIEGLAALPNVSGTHRI